MMAEDRARLERMLSMAEKLTAAIERRGITIERICGDEDVQWFITTPLYSIGEQANNVSRAFADDHPELPLVQIAGLCHRLVHSYEQVNWSLIADIVFTEIPALAVSLRAVLDLPGQDDDSDCPA